MLQHKRRTLSALWSIYYSSTCWSEILTQGAHPNYTGSSARKYQLLPAAFWSFSSFVTQICISQLYKNTLITGSWNAPALGAKQRARASLLLAGLPFLLLTASSQSSTQKCISLRKHPHGLPFFLVMWQTRASACLGEWGGKDCTFSPQHHPSSLLPHRKEKQKVGNAFFACSSCLLSPPGWGSWESVGSITGKAMLFAVLIILESYPM